MLINNVYFSCLSCHVKDCKKNTFHALCCVVATINLTYGVACDAPHILNHLHLYCCK